MIAALPMYDPPALQAANDRLWEGVRAALGKGPDHLSRGGDIWEIWRAPDLVLAQTCGMPYRKCLHRRVKLVAAPDHGLPGLAPGTYQSVIVVRADHPRDLGALDSARMAVNEPLSQSGWAAPMRHLEKAGITPQLILYTGAHVASARAVAEGRVDFAGLDAVTWGILGETHPDLATALRVIDRTAPTPALPFITAAGGDSVALRAALAQAIDGLAPSDRQSLRLHGVVECHASEYLAVPDPVSVASGMGATTP